MIQRMAGPERISATALSGEVGVSQPTLSSWLRDARKVQAMRREKNRKGGTKPPRKWTAEDKLRVVLEASQIQDSDLGAYLRREGIHETQLEQWRTTVVEAATAALSTSGKSKVRKASPEGKRLRELERELNRKDKALAEVAALLALKKKVQEIWGDEDEATPTRRGT